MNRRAILIGASPPSDPLRYVTADIRLWGDFLRSPEGGAWEASEIIDATYLNKSSLLKELERARHIDFTIVVFAGHGYTVQTELPWTEINLILGTGETILERELNSKSPRCCMILDCCRARGDNIEVVSERLKAASLKEIYETMLARAAYINALSQTEKGAVTVYSTGDNTTAADWKSFSQHVIHSAKTWTHNQRGILTIKDAVQIGAAELIKTHPQQHAEYHGGRRLHHFPFAVSV